MEGKFLPLVRSIVPRSKDVVIATNDQLSHQTQSRLFPSLNKALMYFKEECTRKDILIRVQRSHGYAKIYCHNPDCNFYAHLAPVKDSSVGEYLCDKYVPHMENCGSFKIVRIKKRHNFTSTEIAPVLYETVRANKFISLNDCKVTLRRFLSSEPSTEYVFRAKTRAIEDIYGKKELQGAKMLALKAAVEKKGHALDLLECGKSDMRKILLDEDKKRHAVKRKVGNLKKSDKDWKYAMPVDLFKVLDDDFPDAETKFLYGYNFIPSYARTMIHKLLPVIVSDGAHLKNEPNGTMFGTWGLDSNNHVICLCLSVYFDNECTSTWKYHLNAVKKHFPMINSKKFCMISGMLLYYINVYL